MEAIERVAAGILRRAQPAWKPACGSSRACDAVHYAHRKLVLHRSQARQHLVDALGVPKLLDFGIAVASDRGIDLTEQEGGRCRPVRQPEQFAASLTMA
jgi:hypothetical protein